MIRVLFYVLLLAGMLYAVFWVIGRRNEQPPSGPASGPPTGGIKPGPVGPDDDEDFLRELDRKRRHGGKPEDPA